MVAIKPTVPLGPTAAPQPQLRSSLVAINEFDICLYMKLLSSASFERRFFGFAFIINIDIHFAVCASQAYGEFTQ